MPRIGDPLQTTNDHKEFFRLIMDSMDYPYGVKMVYMTGVLPILFNQYFYSWKRAIDKTFRSEFADLFGLTSSEISEALDKLYTEDEVKNRRLKELTCLANGFCFTRPMERREPVFAPETTFHHLNVSYASRQ